MMSIKEELEILRGEPIGVFIGDAMDIPCIDTFDKEKICKHPLVSVHMMAYNHELYIRQAIEGVVMQETDFEFELVIGEDCSKDKTREICFEYQKKYPDKIRVLWWHENVSKFGGNDRRVTARCRGDFIAFCEGDDYWTDSLKLQKQVDVMRKHQSVGLCFGIAEITEMNGTRTVPWDGSAFPTGFMDGKHFFGLNCFGRADRKWAGSEWFLMTQTVMIRKSVFDSACDKYEVLSWGLCMGDVTQWLGVSSLSDAYYIPQVLAVYRRTSSGVCTINGLNVIRDAILVRFYYSMVVVGLSYESALKYWKDHLTISWINHLKSCAVREKILKSLRVLRSSSLRNLFLRPVGLLPFILSLVGILNRVTAYLPIRLVMKFHKNIGWPDFK